MDEDLDLTVKQPKFEQGERIVKACFHYDYAEPQSKWHKLRQLDLLTGLGGIPLCCQFSCCQPFFGVEL